MDLDGQASEEMAYTTIKAKLKKEAGLDLSGFKDAYVKRRIYPRMSACKCASLVEYLRYLTKHPEELPELKDTITVNVTKFFRDIKTYEYVQNTVLPSIISEKGKQIIKRIGIWSAGCSIGEEPYSISIMLHEALGPRLRAFNPQIHATDIDDWALGEAKIGEYDSSAFDEMPQALLPKYFTLNPTSKKYSVNKNVRSIVEFRHQDMIHEPPLPGMDMIFCRNVMIYFEQETHEVIYGKFFESLRPGGYLVIGGSESIHGEMSKKFRAENMYAHVYRKPAE